MRESASQVNNLAKRFTLDRSRWRFVFDPHHVEPDRRWDIPGYRCRCYLHLLPRVTLRSPDLVFHYWSFTLRWLYFWAGLFIRC